MRLQRLYSHLWFKIVFLTKFVHKTDLTNKDIGSPTIQRAINIGNATRIRHVYANFSVSLTLETLIEFSVGKIARF